MEFLRAPSETAGAFLRRGSTFSSLFKRPHDDDAAGG
eukprot:CAMPEP_0173104564 /NCGR_PEP_ID=MMETSP1102-20130122/39368_1 /TAXON_ID=49646 /ORGANISM="Geminigera sp., Strain Caron Lab Isolate" /LENGTH=36 /DNA_ID= /DNA_START= /DNA_END= /DNA_ORIENTATION=